MLEGKTTNLEAESMIKSILFFLAAAIALCSLPSCYHMPTDEDYSLVPSTNNPQSTRQRQDPTTPKISY